jgi:hypothetical protein
MAVKPPVSEFVITDQESFVRALDGTRKFRQLSHQGLHAKLGFRGPVDILRGVKTNLRSDTLVPAFAKLSFEMLLRPAGDRKQEWIFTDQEGFVKALDGMRRYCKLTPQGLADKLNSTAVASLIRGSKDNLRSDSLFSALKVLEFELVVRNITTSTRTQRRLELLKAASQRGEGKDAPDLEITQFDPRRDERGRLKADAVLTDQERADVEAMLDEYGSFN